MYPVWWQDTHPSGTALLSMSLCGGGGGLCFYSSFWSHPMLMSPANFLHYLHEWTYQLEKFCLLVWVCLKFCVQRTDMLCFSYANVVNCLSSAVSISVSSCHFLNLWKWGTALEVQVSPRVKCILPAMVLPQSTAVLVQREGSYSFPHHWPLQAWGKRCLLGYVGH